MKLSRYSDLASQYSELLTSPESQPTLHFIEALLHHPTIHHPHDTSPPTIHHPHHTSSPRYITPTIHHPYRTCTSPRHISSHHTSTPLYIIPIIHHPTIHYPLHTSSPPYITPTIYYPLHTSSTPYNSDYLHCVDVANASIYMAIHLSRTRTPSGQSICCVKRLPDEHALHERLPPRTQRLPTRIS